MKKTIVFEIEENEVGILISALTLMGAMIAIQMKAPLMLNEPLPVILSLSEHRNASKKILKKLRRIEKAASENGRIG
ncbi:MAG: hypothetical protein H0S84_07060 [Bacteroidales bacterium]|jgi:hypothetical protein|nr:hypothetical protein [Bacteroidales bacterium]MDN5349614.1 hypothetical protein [Bacteroidales bacterium]